MYKKIILKVSLITVATLLLQCCLFTKDGCKLTNADKEWLLEEHDSLTYLRNGKDTVAVKVETGFGQDGYDYTFGIRTGDNDYFGYSKIKFSIVNDSISIRTWVNACDDKITVLILKQSIHYAQRYHPLKDSITNIDLMVNGKTYNNCFNFSDQSDTVLQELIFAKNYGVVKFLTHTGDLFELVPFD